MLKQQNPPQRRPQSLETVPLQEKEREKQSIDLRAPLSFPEEKHEPDEQKDWPFLRSAKVDLALLRTNQRDRRTSKGSVLAMLGAVERTINEAKRDGHDDALFATYKTCRAIAQQWYWGKDVYRIFNDTLEDLDREPLRRKKHLSDPELIGENQRIRRLLIAKEQSISILEETNEVLQRSIRANKKTIKEKNVRIAELNGSYDSSAPPSPQGSPRSSSP